MKTNNEIQEEIVTWVSVMLKTKQFGSFGLQVKMHDGIPVNVEKTNAVSYQRKTEGIVSVP